MPSFITLVCDVCHKEQRESVSEMGIPGWGQLKGFACENTDTDEKVMEPLLCPDCMRPLGNEVLRMLRERNKDKEE